MLFAKETSLHIGIRRYAATGRNWFLSDIAEFPCVVNAAGESLRTGKALGIAAESCAGADHRTGGGMRPGLPCTAGLPTGTTRLRIRKTSAALLRILQWSQQDSNL